MPILRASERIVTTDAITSIEFSIICEAGSVNPLRPSSRNS